MAGLHLFGEYRSGRRFVRNERFLFLVLFLLFIQRYLEGADADRGGAEVIAFVDFDVGVDLVVAFKDLGHLIGGDGVKAAAERGELDHIEIVIFCHISCRGVKAGMESPLIADA